mgnify:CR=1 FL=1
MPVRREGKSVEDLPYAEDGPGATIALSSLVGGRMGSDQGRGDGPAHCEIEVKLPPPDENRPFRLLGAEAHWAESFHAPTFRQLLLWSVRIVPWAILEHFLRRWVAAGQTAHRSRIRHAWLCAVTIVSLVVSLHLAPVFIVALAIAWALSWIPLEAAQSLARGTVSLLTGTLGDSYVLLNSAGREAAIADTVLNDLRWLIRSVDARATAGEPEAPARIWIVAHSQGGAIAVRVIQRLLRDAGNTAADLRDRIGLITLGSGYNKLSAFREVMRVNDPTWLSLIFVFMQLFALTALVQLVVHLRQGGWLFPIAVGLTNVGAIGLGYLIVRKIANWRLGKERALTVEWSIGVAVVVSIGTVVLVSALALALNSPALHVGLAVTSAIAATSMAGGLVLSHMRVFSGSPSYNRTQPLRDTSLELERLQWLDFYATHDLVPNGPLEINGLSYKKTEKYPGTEWTSYEVVNRGSILSDHTSYLANGVGVVLPMADAMLDGALLSNDADRDAWRRVRRERKMGAAIRPALVMSAALMGFLLALYRLNWVNSWTPPSGGLVGGLASFVAPDLVRIVLVLAPPIGAALLAGIIWRLELSLRAAALIRGARFGTVPVATPVLVVLAFFMWRCIHKGGEDPTTDPLYPGHTANLAKQIFWQPVERRLLPPERVLPPRVDSKSR